MESFQVTSQIPFISEAVSLMSRAVSLTLRCWPNQFHFLGSYTSSSTQFLRLKENVIIWTFLLCGIRGGALGWGTALQAWRSQVRFPMVSLEIFHWPLPPSSADFLEIWDLQTTEPSGPLQACNGITLPYMMHDRNTNHTTVKHILWENRYSFVGLVKTIILKRIIEKLDVKLWSRFKRRN